MTKITFLLCGIMLFAATGIASAQSGDTGTLHWEIADSTLTITGTGAMPNYYSGGAPWYSHANKITAVVIGDGVTSVGYWAFSRCTLLRTASIGNTVTIIDRGSFNSCSSLVSINFPNSLEVISPEAFTTCSSLTSITIPASVTALEAAFSNCVALIEIVNHATTPQVISNGTFVGVDFAACTLRVPANSMEAYRAADVWKEFLIVGIGNDNPCDNPIASGRINSIIWTLCPNGTLTITGKGAMLDFSTDSSSPWYNHANSITAVVIGDGVTSIGRYAFSNCSELTSVTIPNSVTAIGEWAFSSCTGLASITVPNSVTTISSYAFANCSALTSITIPESVTSIREDAFTGCSGLTAIEVAASNPNYSSEDGVLFNKNKTTLIQYPCGKTGAYTIPEQVTAINRYAFGNCSALTSVTVPESVTTIGTQSFAYCSNLTSIEVALSNPNYSSKDGVLFNRDKTTLIQYPAGKTETSYTIPESVTLIEVTAFSTSEKLTSVTIGSSVNIIKTWAFSYCTSLTSVINLATTPQIIDAEFRDVDISTCTLRVPASSVEAYRAANEWKEFGTIEAIDDDTPCDNPIASGITGTLEWMLCPNGTLTITGTGAMPNYGWASSPWYDWRESISSVVIGDGVTSIGGYAFFSDFFSLESVTIGNSVTTIGSNAFYLCAGLISFEVTPSNPNYSSENGVLFNKNKTVLIQYPTAKTGTYTIPSSVNTIGEKAFYGCTMLTSVTIPNSVTSIENYAFMGCQKLTTVAIPQSVISIGESVFAGCIGLTAIEVAASNPNYSSENGVLFNKDKTTLLLYSGGKAEASYTIPSSVSAIGAYAFYDSRLTSISIPNSVNSIGAYAFYFNNSLTSIVIPNSVIIIGRAAFTYCQRLISVTIGSSVNTIGESAFAGCISLTSVTNLATTPQTINDDVFSGSTDISTCTLRVPANSMEAYRTADVWKEFLIESITSNISNSTFAGITVYGSGSSICITNSSGTALNEIVITDMQGRIVYSDKGRKYSTPTETIPINSGSGIYIVKLVSDDGKTLSTKVHLTR